MSYQTPITRTHPTQNYIQELGFLTFDDTLAFYAQEGFKFVLEAVIDDGGIVEFVVKVYPESYEMEANF